MNERTQRFPVGTEFKTRGKHPPLCTVVDYLETRNLAGKLVRREYVEEHEFCGQTVRSTVPEATVAMGLVQ